VKDFLSESTLHCPVNAAASQTSPWTGDDRSRSATVGRECSLACCKQKADGIAVAHCRSRRAGGDRRDREEQGLRVWCGMERRVRLRGKEQPGRMCACITQHDRVMFMYHDARMRHAYHDAFIGSAHGCQRDLWAESLKPRSCGARSQGKIFERVGK